MSADSQGALAASVHSTNETGFAVETRVRRHRLLADEPTASGGTDTAPTPLEMLATGLASCTAITLRMYAERKGWALGTVKVDCRGFVEGKGYRFERRITLGAPLTDEQRGRLAEIADRTPVTRVVMSGAPVATELRAPG